MLDIIESALERKEVRKVSATFPLRKKGALKASGVIGQRHAYRYEVDSCDTLEAIHLIHSNVAGEVEAYARLTPINAGPLTCTLRRALINHAEIIEAPSAMQLHRICVAEDDARMLSVLLLSALRKASETGASHIVSFADKRGLEQLMSLGLDLDYASAKILDETRTLHVFSIACSQKNRTLLNPMKVVEPQKATTDQPVKLTEDDELLISLARIAAAGHNGLVTTAGPSEQRSHLRLV